MSLWVLYMVGMPLILGWTILNYQFCKSNSQMLVQSCGSAQYWLCDMARKTMWSPFLHLIVWHLCGCCFLLLPCWCLYLSLFSKRNMWMVLVCACAYMHVHLCVFMWIGLELEEEDPRHSLHMGQGLVSTRVVYMTVFIQGWFGERISEAYPGFSLLRSSEDFLLPASQL